MMEYKHNATSKAEGLLSKLYTNSIDTLVRCHGETCTLLKVTTEFHFDMLKTAQTI